MKTEVARNKALIFPQWMGRPPRSRVCKVSKPNGVVRSKGWGPGRQAGNRPVWEEADPRDCQDGLDSGKD